MVLKSVALSLDPTITAKLVKVLFSQPSLKFLLSLLVFEFLFCLLILRISTFWDIDWYTYITQAEQIWSGERDYSKVSGHSGLLVYPAGHVYAILGILGVFGRTLFVQQHVFACIYTITLGFVFLTMKKCKLPLWTFVACCLSRRLHSIYLLRMFNDCICMLFAFAAIYLFVSKRWKTACFIYSLSVSIKMNALLFAPGVLFVLANQLGLLRACWVIFCFCAIPQLILGLPFLLTHPNQYIKGAFDLSRVFMHEWTVNWKFVPESFFVSKIFANLLLLCTLFFWGFAFWFIWRKLDINKSENILYVLLTSNFIGVAFSRTLHYQFLTWYWMTLPGMLHFIEFSNNHLIQLLSSFSTILAVEFAFNQFPSTAIGSFVLQAAHSVVLVGLFRTMANVKAKLN